MNGTIQRRLTVLETALRPTRGCWILPIQIGESTEQALLRHARDPELAGRAFALLPVKRGLNEEVRS
jgi:hypothetical protein